MRKYLLAIFILFIVIPPTHAQETVPNWYEDEYKQCNELNTNEIIACNQKFINSWDARLNKAYKELINNKIHNGSTKNEKPRTKNLIEAQRLWIQYRDANCNYYHDRQGTISRIETSECMRIMTARRALELEQENKTY